MADSKALPGPRHPHSEDPHERRTERLRQESLEASPPSAPNGPSWSLPSTGRTWAGTTFPVLRARAFLDLCRHKTVWLGHGELIVGERGPSPRPCPPSRSSPATAWRTCASSTPGPNQLPRGSEHARDLRTGDHPLLAGPHLRDQIFRVPPEWHEAYEAGLFTEFMEQRAPGHTVLDGKIYGKGMLDFKADIAAARAGWTSTGPRGLGQAGSCRPWTSPATRHALAERHAEQAERQAAAEADPARRRSSSTSPRSAAGFRPRRPGTSRRPCRTTGSATWA